MKLADDIREFAYREYIKPARDQSLHEVTIRTGDVHDKMGLSGRLPAVCGAIGTGVFEKKYRVTITKRRGVTNGANVFFTLLLINDQRSSIIK